MYIILCLIAALGYSLQIMLMAKFYRSHDPLSTTAYRGISLGISMLPLLFFVPAEAWPGLFENIPILLGASLAAAVGNWLMGIAFRHLQLGIAGAMLSALRNLILLAVGFIFFMEKLSLEQIVLIFALIIAISLLSATKTTGSVPKDFNLNKGIIYCVSSSIAISLAFAGFAALTRLTHPFLAGYAWEFIIGIIAMILAFSRGIVTDTGIQRIEFRTFGKILAYASPTVVGSGLLGLAFMQGPVALCSSVVSIAVVYNALLGWLIHKENLTRVQWSCIILVWLSIGMLSLVK